MKNAAAFVFLLLVVPAFAAINPVYKECSQRGYAIWGNTCIFPDNSSCDLEEFNDGICGSQWLTQDYCVKQGGNVWDDDRCCSGLRPYLPAGVAGQPTCEPVLPESSAGIIFYLVLLFAVMAAGAYMMFSRVGKKK